VSRTVPSRWQGLPLSILAAHQRQRHGGRACPCERVFHAQVCALHRTHISILAARQRQRQMAGLAPCERVFHARVCALQITHISILAARQRRCHDGRACPCERVFHAQVCAFHRTHLSILAAHQRQRHGGRACPLRACVPRSVVCASSHTHLYSRNTSKTVPRRQGLPPASVCSTLGCVTFKSHIQITHISILAARQRQCHDGRACPLRACVPHSGV